MPSAQDVALRPVSELTHLGKPLPLLDAPAYVTGQAIYGADVKLPGMLTAVIARPPVVGGKVARFDATRALAVPGVRKVIEVPPPKPPVRFPAVGWHRGGGGSHLGRDAWTSRARRHVGVTVRTAVTTRPSTARPLPRRSRCPGRSHARWVTRRRR